MENRIRELLITISTSNEVSDEIKLQAKGILNEEFKNEIRNNFKYFLIDKTYDNWHREIIKNGTKCGFIAHFYDYETFKKFLDDNYDRIDEIISILREYVDEIEKQEVGEDGNE